MKRLGRLFLVVLLILAVAACGQTPASQDPGQEDILVIAGLSQQPLEVPVAEILELESVSGVANTINSSNEASQKEYTGVTIQTVLAHYGLGLEGATALVVNAGDGYSVEVTQEILQGRDLILAWEIDGSPLEVKDGPLRLVVPDERSLYWVRNITELVFDKGPASAAVTELVFFEDMFPELQTQVYTYYGSEDLAVNIEQLVDTDQVILVASDGLTKNENLRSDLSYFVKVEGDDSPLFISPSIPKGMYVKDLGLLIHGSQVVIFAKPFLEGDRVDMEAVMEHLAAYLGEGTVTLTLAGEDVSVTAGELAGMNLRLTDNGIVIE